MLIVSFEMYDNIVIEFLFFIVEILFRFTFIFFIFYDCVLKCFYLYIKVVYFMNFIIILIIGRFRI